MQPFKNKSKYSPYPGFYDLRVFNLNPKEFSAAWRMQDFLYRQSLKREYYKCFAPPVSYTHLAVFTSIEFYQPVQLVESLYNIRTYYMQALEKLKKELQSSQMKTLYLTEVSQAAERKAA